jgi:hypothetical protein
MIAWLAARSDGDDYGHMLVFKFPKRKIVYGPRQIEARIDQNSEISSQLTLWGQRGSQVIRGNLLVIPVEESLLYVEPLFLEATDTQLPELRRVIVAYGNDIVMEETLDEALRSLFGQAAPEPPEDTQPPDGQQPAGDLAGKTTEELISMATQLYEQAQSALSQSDFSAYGSYIEELGRVLSELDRRSQGNQQ